MSSFTRPTIGPKVYLSRGPSGHSETFRRELADVALQTFLGQISLKIAVEGFLRKKARERTPDEWSDILSYISSLLQVEPDSLPIDVCVAFWANVLLFREAEKKAKCAATGN